MRLLAAPLLAALALAWAVPAAAQETEAVFTERVAAQFRAALPAGTVRVAESLMLEVSGAQGREPHRAGLSGLWRGCLRVPATCTSETENFVRQLVLIVTETAPPPITRDRLRVAVRSRQFCAQVRTALGQRGQGNPVLMRDQAPDLCLVLMVQYDGRRSGLNQNDLGPLGLNAEDAWQLARRQTLAGLPAPPLADAFAAGAINALQSLDYAPSFLLDPDAWRPLAAGAGLAIAVPSDDSFVVARLPIADLAAFRSQVRTHFEQAEVGVSPNVYRWTEHGWELWAE